MKSQLKESTYSEEPSNNTGIDDSFNDHSSMSYFEFWPTWLFYFPMRIYALYLFIRYRSITLPTLTNPSFDLGGFHGESKLQIETLIPKDISSKFALSIPLRKEHDQNSRKILEQGLEAIKSRGWNFPLVVKPDIGMRGLGVQCVKREEDLLEYIDSFPSEATMIVQELFDYPLEVGLFYVRKPNEEKGSIFSLTIKCFSYVTGNGQSSLKNLIESHPRFGKISHLYLPRHRDKLDLVLDKGEQFKIAFAGSHSGGTVFKNGNHLITEKMTETWDKLAKQIPHFYFGRFDIRLFKLEDLETLDNIKIIEVNGSGAEATHIWDPKTKLIDAYKTLMKQYNLALEIATINKKNGFKAVSLKTFLQRMRRASELCKVYPEIH